MPESLAQTPESPNARAARPWLALLVILVACAPSLTLGIGPRLSTHTMENVALVTSQESWLRLADGDRSAWLISTNDGVPRFEKPPMLTWLNLLAWSDLDPAQATPQQLTFRARCVTAALGLMMLASIFWMGCTLADVRLAMLGTLMVGSTFFFQRQARTASYDIHYVAWTTLAVASGLWAMRPLGAAPSMRRRVVGWGACAIGLFAAVMSKNPLPFVLALPPLIFAIALLSPRRRADALWLTAATLLAAAPVAAWYAHAFDAFPELARRELLREVRQPRGGDFQPVYYYVGLLGLVAPWTVWLVGGLIEPFRIAIRERRRVAFLAFFWFALIFVAMSIPAAKQQRYILTILPSVGLLIAVFFRQHDERAATGRDDRLFRITFAGTWIVLIVASLATPWFLAHPAQYHAMTQPSIDHPELLVIPLSRPLALALAIALLASCVEGWRCHAKAPWRSAIAMAAWVLVAMSTFWNQESIAPAQRVQAFVDEAARVHHIVRDAPLRSLRRPGSDANWKLNEEFRFYYGRLIRRVGFDDIHAWLRAASDEAFILARQSPTTTRLLQQNGFELIDHVVVDRDDSHELWRWQAPTSAADESIP